MSLSLSTSFCVICSKNFKNSTGLKIHCAKVHNKSFLDTSCPDSSKSFNVSRDNKKTADLHIRLVELRRTTKIIKRIPKAARLLSAFTLSTLLEDCVRLNTADSWENLLIFPFKSFNVCSNSINRKISLATLIKRNINNYSDQIPSSPVPSRKRTTQTKFSLKRIIDKVSDGDLSGAVKILCSNDVLADFDETTFLELQSKHPLENPGSVYPTNFPTMTPLIVSENDVRVAIQSFRTSSSGGLDSLRPSHIQDMISYSAGSAGIRLLSSLTVFCNFLLSGTINTEICPVLFGASLCGLTKKDGGVRPIAVGMFYRRLVAKLACLKLKEKLGEFLRPLQ